MQQEDEGIDVVHCEGCGYDFEAVEMSGVILVHLQDGGTRELQLCSPVCFDFWAFSEPGDWVKLASGEKVQRAVWTCQKCATAYDYAKVQLLIDVLDYDPDDHVSEWHPEEWVICDTCHKAQPERFKTRREVGL